MAQNFKFLRKNRDCYYSFRIPFSGGHIIMELTKSDYDEGELLVIAEIFIEKYLDLTLDKFHGIHLKLDEIGKSMSFYACVNALGYESNGTHYKTGMYRDLFNAI